MKGDDIADRLLDLGVACLRLAGELERTPTGKHVARQLSRSATSGGANYGEARSAESASDFIHKTAIAAKEVGETVYWLKLAQRAGLVDTTDSARWADEAGQLVRILAASIRTTKCRSATRSGP